MPKRNIINIDAEKCNGCGQCIPNCPEGAIQVIDGKARLISDLFCDGLGACIGYCPEGAITIEEREAQAYDERKVMENIVRQGPNVIKAHLEHLKGHGEHKYLQEALSFLKEKMIAVPAEGEAGQGAHHGEGGCPGSKMMDMRNKEAAKNDKKGVKLDSQLSQWPVQLMLVPAGAPYFDNADLLICADCVPFAYANFHQGLLKGKILLVGCPKLDNTEIYRQKLMDIFKNNNLRSVTYAHMEVPCCFGLVGIIREAITFSGKDIPFEEVNIGIKGERLK